MTGKKGKARAKKYYLFICKGCKNGECHVIWYKPTTKESENHRLQNCDHPNKKWVPVGGR